MDIYDSATETEEKHRATALENHAKLAARARLMPVGLCLNCDDRVEPGVLFCHPTCTHDYQKWQASHSRVGRTGD